VTIERHQTGMLTREAIPAARWQARFSSCAHHQASRYRNPNAGVAAQGGSSLRHPFQSNSPRLGFAPFYIQVGEDLLDDVGILNARDDSYRTAADRAGLDVDPEDPFQALRPGHRGAAFGWRGLLRIRGPGMPAASPAPPDYARVLTGSSAT